MLDHAGVMRGAPEVLAKLWCTPGSRLLVIDQQGRFDPEPFGQPIPADAEPYPAEATVFLGLLRGVAWFARRGTGERACTVRESSLDPGQRQVAVAAIAVLNWYRNNQYCVVCGGQLTRTRGGYSAVCTNCGRETFPRTDPAVICGVRDPDNRLFLAHQATWPAHRVSILAGFIEAGESAEQAVHREIQEEASLRLTGLHYLGSQPWPMPRSLMFSYVATSNDAGQVDGDELAWGHWYTRDEVRRRVAGGQLELPAGSSVGHHIISLWLDGRLPEPISG